MLKELDIIGWAVAPIECSREQVFTEYMHASMIKFLDRYFGSLNEIAQDSVLHYISQNIDRFVALSDFWQPAYALKTNHNTSDENPEVQLLRIAAYMASNGAEGSFRINLKHEILVYFDTFPLHLSGEVVWTQGPDSCSVTSSNLTDTRPNSFNRIRGRWRRDDLASDIYVGCDGAIILHSKSTGFEDSSLTLGDHMSAVESPRLHELISNTMTNIAKASRNYEQWLMAVLRAVVFLKPSGAVTKSHSSMTHPGLICLTYPIRLDHAGILLVHEVAHQHLFRLHSILPLVNGLDENLYYSPFRKTERPLFYILLALHAAFNMHAHIEQQLERNPNADHGYLASEINKLAPQIAQMLVSIQGSIGLTEYGKAFVGRMNDAFRFDKTSV